MFLNHEHVECDTQDNGRRRDRYPAVARAPGFFARRIANATAAPGTLQVPMSSILVVEKAR